MTAFDFIPRGDVLYAQPRGVEVPEDDWEFFRVEDLSERYAARVGIKRNYWDEGHEYAHHLVGLALEDFPGVDRRDLDIDFGGDDVEQIVEECEPFPLRVSAVALPKDENIDTEARAEVTEYLEELSEAKELEDDTQHRLMEAAERAVAEAVERFQEEGKEE